MPAPRESTNRLLELIEEGVLDKDQVIMACVKYMSEDDVADMCHDNEFFDSVCIECGVIGDEDLEDGYCTQCHRAKFGEYGDED